MDSSSSSKFVPFWYTKLGEAEIAAVADAIRSEHLSQGPNTMQLERRLAEFLGVPYVVLTTSGSVALFLAFSAVGIGPGDEVIVPNRTFIATAHAALMTGAKVRLVDCRPDSPVIDEAQIERAVTPRTKAIAPVHLNGRSADMRAIGEIAERRGLFVVEDAAQAFASRNADGLLGTQGTIGCWSLGVTKLITTGQGGFVATRDKQLYDRLLLFRSHGVANTFATSYGRMGLNFRYNDILASIGLVQIEKVEAKIRRHIEVYRWYERELADLPFVRNIPVNIEAGEVPLWVEVLCAERERVMAHLEAANIQARPFLPDLSESPHLENDDAQFVNSKTFAKFGMFVPVGPDLPWESMELTVAALRELRGKVQPLEAVLHNEAGASSR